MSKRALILSLAGPAVLMVVLFWGISMQSSHSSQTDWIAPANGQARLQGQPNWRTRMANGRLPAPPHHVSGHTWHHPD